MEITYEKEKPFHYNDFFTPVQTSNKPNILINDLGYKYYTLIMYDPDAVKGNYWHWILSNIKSGEKIDSKNIILDYYGPNPPDSKKHRYIFQLYGSNKMYPKISFDSRTVSLEEGKNLLQLNSLPILQTLFISQREKGGTKKIRTSRTKKYNKGYRRKSQRHNKNKRNKT